MKVLKLLTFAAAFGASITVSMAQDAAPVLTTLYNGGSYVNLVLGGNGAIYGTGKNGVVFELTPPASPGGAWTQTVVHTFTGQNGDGAAPYACPVRAKSGSLYGTTQEGGLGFGTVYQLTPPAAPGGDWTETVIYNFLGGTDGSYPFTSLTMGKSGALYGTTSVGGEAGTPVGCNGLGCGTVFALTPPAAPGGTWTETVLYKFTGGSDGGGPSASLIIGPKGEIYGTTEYGGTSADGTVFELTPPAAPGGPWTETVLHTFTGQNGDGAFAWSSPVMAPNGVLYGTTLAGGASNIGTVYAVAPPTTHGGPWTETVLYSFTGGSDGSDPLGGVIIGNHGVLYGTTLNFGSSKSCTGNDCGTVFALKPPAAPGGVWTEITLYSFPGGPAGAAPWAGLVVGKSGALYGTTAVAGTSNTGTVFELTP